MSHYSSVIGARYRVDAAAGDKSMRRQVVTGMVSGLLKEMLVCREYAPEAARNAGIVIGSQYGRVEFITKGGEQATRLGLADYCNPNYFVHSVSSAIPGQAAIDNHIGAETISINTSELSGLDSIGYAHCAVLTSDALYFAGGADSACAIHASGKHPGKAKILDGAGLITLCRPGTATPPPLAHISHYAGTQLPGTPHAFEDRLQQLLTDLRPHYAEVLLITFGAATPAGEWLEEQVPFVADHTHMENTIGIMGGAGGAVAIAMLLSGEKLFRKAAPWPTRSPVIVAGTSSRQKYAHLLVHPAPPRASK